MPVVCYTYDAYGVPRVVGGSGPGLPPFGDADGDGDVDLADFAAFQVCYRGAGVPYGSGCGTFDADLDGDVDQRDLRVFLVLLEGRGDFDHDLDIDADDWAPFAACLTGPGVPLSADATEDGWVDAADFQLWTACATAPGVLVGGSCTWADLDGDGDADLADFARLTLQVGLGLDPACRPADLDGDLDVDLADAGRFQAVFTGPRGGGPEPAPDNPYLFTGRRLDFDLRDGNGRPLLVLYDYRARAYDPFHGRFCQRDPALYSESLNLYQYALSNPASRFDPSGWFTLAELGGVTSFRTDWDLSTLDVSMSLLDAVRGFAALVNTRNMLLSELTGVPAASVDLSGIDAVLGVWETYQTAQSALLVGGVVQAGVKFGARGARALVDALSERAGTVRHHGIPLFMGGVESFNRLTGQIEYHVPAALHNEFHRLLNRRLQEAGFPAHNADFGEFLKGNAGSQARAFDVLRQVANEFDARYGTSFTVAFDVNFLLQAFEPYGW